MANPDKILGSEALPRKHSEIDYENLLTNYDAAVQEIIQLTEGTSTPREYFAYALEQAGIAARTTYAVGACLVIPYKRRELILIGRNRVFEQGNSALHAEADVMDKFELMEQVILNDLPFSEEQAVTLKPYIKDLRPINSSKSEISLYTTPQPCNACNSRLKDTMD